MLFDRRKTEMVTPERALPGRAAPAFAVPATHEVLGTPLQPPFPKGLETVALGAGCFWGVERLFWQIDGVYTTAAGYAGGYTPNPTYEEVCTGLTAHAEVVLVVYDPNKVSFATLVKTFFEEHDPTQGMRQGNDIGTQYRSAIYFTTPEQERIARAALADFQQSLKEAGYGAITTEVAPLDRFYYAEDYHQQYLHKNPGGYCGLKGTGVQCRIPAAASEV